MHGHDAEFLNTGMNFAKAPSFRFRRGLPIFCYSACCCRSAFSIGHIEKPVSPVAAATFFYTVKIFVLVHLLIKKENKPAVFNLYFSIKNKIGANYARKCCRLIQRNLPAARFADRILH
ncbi:hypothetical protein [Neisseria dentiae]|uniref:hypothetical protein n=1 Tax=Neisseria dentiae TaxID=194197 RepID=UPI00359F627B